MKQVVQIIIDAGLTLWIGLTILFVALRIFPTNVLVSQLTEAGLPETEIQEQIKRYGLDKPIVDQYLVYLSQLSRGDFGRSMATGQPIGMLIVPRFWKTVELAMFTLMISMPIGVIWGIGATYKSPIGYLLSGLTALSLAIPIYWSGTLVLLLITLWAGIPQSNFGLPMAVLSFHISGNLARITQQSFRAIDQEPFVLFAKSKGLKRSRIFFYHKLRLALLPVISVLPIQISFLMGGTAITESLFSRAGMGKFLLDAVIARDYPIVQIVVTVLMVIFIVSNVATKLIIVWLDPRLSQ